MTNRSAQEALCRKLNIDYAGAAAGLNELFSITDIREWVNLGAQRAWDRMLRMSQTYDD